MAVTVRIPTPLQRLTNGQGEVQCQGASVTELLSDLERRYPGIKERICDQDGKLRRFVNVFVNEEDIRFLQGDQTAIKDGDEVSIIPAIAGGADRDGVRPKVWGQAPFFGNISEDGA
jgi:molybdopterin synthase sulfur carrier subunit